MAVQIEVSPELVVAYLSGEIDHHNAAGIRAQIDETASRVYPQELILDFSSVTFIDSSAIGLVMGRYRLMKDLEGSLKITNLSESYKRVMKLAGMDKLGVME